MSTQLSMYELMLVLKRIDKCKNGVVSENEFVDYFLVKMWLVSEENSIEKNRI